MQYLDRSDRTERDSLHEPEIIKQDEPARSLDMCRDAYMLVEASPTHSGDSSGFLPLARTLLGANGILSSPSWTMASQGRRSTLMGDCDILHPPRECVSDNAIEIHGG